MAKIVMYTKADCPYCHLAKDLLTQRGAEFTEIRIDLDDSQREEMMRRSQRRTVPQIFINDEPIGGYDDLAQLARSGKLNDLLNT